MKRLTRRPVGQAALIMLPAVTLVAVLVFIGLVVSWPMSVTALVVVISVCAGIYVLMALRAGVDLRRRWLRYGQAAVAIALTMAGLVGAAITYQRWVRVPQQGTDDLHEVAAEASTVAHLLTSVSNGDRTDYLHQLRPHVTDDVLQALNGNVAGLVPAAPFTQDGVVTSVAVELVHDGAATAIAVVKPMPPPPPKGVDPDPNNVILFLILARYQDRWVVANLAPLGVRSGYPG
jgi:hypothetical protein